MRAIRRLAPVVGVLALTILLTGCMSVGRSLTINQNGSGQYALTLGFHEPTPGDRNSVPQQVTIPLEAFSTHVSGTGGSVNRTEDHGYAYWTFSRPFMSIAQADALLQEDPRQYDANHEPVLYHDALHIATVHQLLGTAVHVTGTISLVDLLNNAQAWKDATESFSIIMPGGIGAHRGGTVNGDTVTYAIGYNQSAKVDVTGEVNGQFAFVSSDALLLEAGGLILVAFLLLVFGVFFLRRALAR